jgi:hypothetical protein
MKGPLGAPWAGDNGDRLQRIILTLLVIELPAIILESIKEVNLERIRRSHLSASLLFESLAIFIREHVFLF